MVRGAGSVGFTEIRYFDPLQRLSSLHHDLPGTASDQSFGYGYNSASQLISRSAGNDAYAWTGHYDVSRGYSVNGLNQYTSAGPATFAYDANGNLTSDGSTSFVYDAENRLVSASGAKTASLSYDPLGRLLQTSGGAAGTTQFLYDGDALVAEYDGAGTLLRRYVHGGGTDDPVAVYEGAALGLANRAYQEGDERGSVIALVNSDGSIKGINSYDSWGIPGANNQGRFQYTGQAWIAELGMYHYKARIYSPTLGRFLQTDPIGYEDQLNLYAYAENDPINISDPMGLAGECSTGSRTGYNTSFCRVHEGYAIPTQGAGQGGAGRIGSGYTTLGERVLRLMRRDPEVRRAMALAWIRSRATGPANQKREHGFWLQRVKNDFIIGRMISGDATSISSTTIDAAKAELPGAQIFFHVHPNRVGENFVTRTGISLKDQGVAGRHNAIVVSLGHGPGTRDDPPGYDFDVEDTFYRPRRR